MRNDGRSLRLGVLTAMSYDERSLLLRVLTYMTAMKYDERSLIQRVLTGMRYDERSLNTESSDSNEV